MMENGVHKVDEEVEVELKVGESGEDVNGTESVVVEATVADGGEDKVDKNGDDSVEIETDKEPVDSVEAQTVKEPVDSVEAQTVNEPVDSVKVQRVNESVDSVETQTVNESIDSVEAQRVNESADSVEEVASLKVIDVESASGSSTVDQHIVNEDGKNNEHADVEEAEVKLLSFVEVTEEANEGVNDGFSEAKVVDLLKEVDGESTSGASSNQPSGVEVNEGLNDGFGEAKVVDLVQEVDGESTSGAGSNQLSEVEVNEGVSDGFSEAKVVDLVQAVDENSELETDVVGEKDEVNKVSDEKKISMDVSGDEPSMLENNEVKDDRNKDEESTSNKDVLGEVSELETDELVVGEKDDLSVLESNEAKDNGINEAGKVVNKDVSEVVHEVEKPVAVALETSEKGVPDNAVLVETVVLEDGVNGDHVSGKIQPDGEIGVEVNGDLNEKDNLVTESKDDDSYKQKEKLETLSEQNGSTVEQIQDNKEVEESTLATDKNSEPKNDEVKQESPVKKEPEPKPNPIIGVSLSTHKPAPPKPDSKPNQSSTPPPTPTPTPAPTRPAGLGTGAPLLEPAHRVVPQSQPNGTASLQNQVIDEPPNGEPDETDETREKLQMIRVKFLRLARRLGQTPHNVVVAQVLYRLGLAEQLRGSNSNGGRVAAFSFERANAMAEQLEAAGQEPLEFSCTIMVIGKTGVGKSATINSIFDEVKFPTDAFHHGTKKVQDVVGTVQGIKVRVIDTPGLHSSWADQRKNEKILQSVKRFIQNSPPDIVLYLDRLDMQSRDFGDMPLLKTITDIFGQSIWFNAIVVLTHAASAPPEGANGTATSYDLFVTQRSHVVQQAIRQAAGDMRLMNPVSLVENHSACRTNRAGQRVLPNGQVWKPHLLLLSFASKILVEANMLLKLQDSPPGKPFARTRAPPLPYILSNLLQSRPQLKLPQDESDDDDDDVDESDDEESEEELPPFKRLTSQQLSKLSKAQKKSYYDELEYREKLFMKKQLKEERKRRKFMKKMAEEAKDYYNNNNNNDNNNNVEEDGNGAATVPVAVQDMNLPVSFDADNPTHRYRAIDSGNQWLTRPVLDPHGWDHDVGYEGINVEHMLAVKDKIPVSFTGQITKDKKDANLQVEVSSALKHGKSGTTVAFDMQTVGKDLSYTLRSDTRFINYRKNKASAGFSATYFGDTLTGGVKFEDKLTVSKRGQLVVAGGAVIGRGDVAYGGSLEGTLRDKDHPLGRFLTTIGVSVMDWHGDLALGWNAQSQIPIGRFSNLIGRVNLNNKGSGQVSVRLNSSEQIQIALAALVPLASKLLGYYQDRDSAY